MTYQTEMCVLQYRDEVLGEDVAEIEVYATEEQAVNRLYEILEEDYSIRPRSTDLNLTGLEDWCRERNIIVSFSFHRLEQKK